MRKTSAQLSVFGNQILDQQLKSESDASLLHTFFEGDMMSMIVLTSVRSKDGLIIDFELTYAKSRTEIVANQSDLQGKHLLTELPGSKNSGLFDKLVKVVETGISLDETIHVSHDGLDLWFLVKISKYNDGCLIIYSDTTKQKNAELEIKYLREEKALLNREKYISLFNSINEGFGIIEIIINKDGQATDWIYREVNPAFERQIGIGDIAGKSLSEVIPGEDHCWIDRFADVVTNGKAAEFIEYSRPLKKWFEVSASCFGHPAERLVAILLTDVTQRKLAEEKLKESRERYQAMIETNADFMWEVDVNGRYTYCSPQMKNLWGLNPEDMLGKPMYTLIPEEDRQKYIYEFRKNLKKAAPFKNLEGESIDCNGNIVSIETSGVPFFSYHGQLLGFRGITRDVTSRKKQEEELRISESKFRSIVETANEGVCQLDDNLIVRYVNEKICQLGLFTEEELIGQPIWKFLSNEEFSRLKKIIPKIKKGLSRHFEIKLMRKDHHEIIVSVNTAALQDNQGNYTGYVGMITDITERVSIERDLKRTRRKLQAALRNANIGTWEWNLKTGELYCDRRMEEIFGLKPRSFDGRLSSFEACIHEEDISYVDDAIKKALRDRSYFEVIFRTKPVQGKFNYVLSKASITRDRKGNAVNVSGVCFDVTDMKEGTEKALIRLNEDLLRSNSDLQQFAYVASHDLQEPLRMVSSFTQLLQQRYAEKLDKDANDYISYAVNGSRRMYELLNGLLAYSRIQTRGREFAEVNMNFVIEKVKANIKLLIDEATATINSCELPVIKADENQMIQLMQNLIENAVKFSNGKPVISISASSKGDAQIFSVKDNGIGIEPVYFEKIFRIFQRLHHSEYPGTGIGLAICQRIVERHGGKIWVSSKPGDGSVFSFSIPA